MAVVAVAIVVFVAAVVAASPTHLCNFTMSLSQV